MPAQVVPIALVQLFQLSTIVHGAVEAAVEIGRGCDAVEGNAGHCWS
jgi:hypothetical protein